MNRSILIVICDFLLVSLLVFSTVDINDAVKDGKAQPMTATVGTNRVDSGNDLAAVMKLALEDEKKNRDLLVSELSRTRDAASEREKQLAASQEKLQTTEQQRSALQQQYAAAQTNIHSLNANVQSLSANIDSLNQQAKVTASDAIMSREKLAAMEAELRKRAEEAAALQQRLASLSSSNQSVLNEKQRLAGQLQVAEVERRHAAEQVMAMAEQVKIERAEKARLAEGVKALATNSTQLVKEIRENRALTPNTIFDEFTANRIRATINGVRSGLWDSSKHRDTASVLVTDGTNTYALSHVEDTPLTFWSPGAQWNTLTGNLKRGNAEVPIRSLSFLFQEPRVVYMPVPKDDATKLGGKVYRISNVPFKFQDAVLIGANESYYGECKFEIDVSTPGYVKLDRSLLKGLFGKFNPSRGDLVFTKTGDLLGIMANSTYCYLVTRFDPTATFTFGPDTRAQRTGDTLAALYTVVQQMPMKLQ